MTQATVAAANSINDHMLGTSAWTFDGTMFLGFTTPTARVVTFTNATNLVNDTATPKANGDRVIFNAGSGGTLPTGITAQLSYFVINKNVNDYQVSLTSGGAAVTFSDDGTPTNNSYEALDDDASNIAAIEASTGGYARAANVFGASAAGVATNTTVHSFDASGADFGDCIEWFIADTVTAGIINVYAPFTTFRTILDGESLTVAAAALSVTTD